MKLGIKKGDTVEVIAGSEKGKKGAVLEIKKTAPLKVRVQGIKIATHFDKKEGLLKKEALFDYSNVKLVEKTAAAAKKSKSKKKESSASKN